MAAWSAAISSVLIPCAETESVSAKFCPPAVAEALPRSALTIGATIGPTIGSVDSVDTKWSTKSSAKGYKTTVVMSKLVKLTGRPCCDGPGGRLGLSFVGRTVHGGMHRRVEDVVTTWRNRQTRIDGVSCWRSQGRARRRKGESSEEDGRTGRQFHIEEQVASACRCERI